MYNFRPSFLQTIPPVVKNLIAINLILWLSTIVLPDIFSRWGIDIDLIDLIGMHYWGSTKFNPIQLVTYAFLHGGFNHIFFNMFALYMFGTVLEELWGTKRFLFYYLITAIGAGIVQQVFWTFELQPIMQTLNDTISTYKVDSFITIGASGSVFGLLLAFGWLFPDAKMMLLFLPIPIKAWIFVILYGCIELFMGVAQFSGDSVAHFAHLGGMLFGAIVIMYWKRKKHW